MFSFLKAFWLVIYLSSQWQDTHVDNFWYQISPNDIRNFFCLYLCRKYAVFEIKLWFSRATTILTNSSWNLEVISQMFGLPFWSFNVGWLSYKTSSFQAGKTQVAKWCLLLNFATILSSITTRTKFLSYQVFAGIPATLLAKLEKGIQNKRTKWSMRSKRGDNALFDKSTSSLIWQIKNVRRLLAFRE